MHIVRIATSLLFVLCLASGAIADELTPGDRAPSLEGATWIRGKGIKSIVPGSVYVITFFNSTSEKSRDSFPILSRLSTTHQESTRVVAISVDPLDAQAAEQLRDRHVKEMKFDFAIDTASTDGRDAAVPEGRGAVAKKWLDGIATNRLPVTYVIDPQGKIAFIGEPAAAGQMVDSVVSGDFTADDARISFEDEMNVEWVRVQAELDQKPLQLQLLGDNAAAAAAIESLIKKYPRSRPRLLCEQFYALMRAEKYEAAYTVVDAAAHYNVRSALSLNELAWFIVDDEGVVERDLDRALAISTRSVELEPNNGAYLDTLARIHFELGDIDKAYDLQLKAVEHATPRDHDELVASLDRYRNALPK